MGRDKTPLVKQLNTETYLFIFFFYCFVYSRCIFIGKVGFMTKKCTKKFNALCYASVNSSGAHPPPRANPRALAFFFLKMANSRGWGQVSPSNAPGWDQNRRQMPHPRDHLESNTAQD